MKILLLTSSILGDNSQSNHLVDHYKAQLKAQGIQVEWIERDLAVNSLPHLTAEEMGSWMAETPTEAQQQLRQRSDDLIDEIKAADRIVLAVPMYNFGIPTQLKAWFDRVLRAGATFRYTADGPVALLDAKPVLILATRGGLYAGTPADTQTPHLKSLLGMIGQTDVEFIYAEGVSMGDEAKQKAIANAESEIEAHVKAMA